jgi:PLP dependent protein
MASISDNVAAVRALIADACHRSRRQPSEVRLIAVTKSQGPEVLAQLSAEGVCDFGENRVDHLELMRTAAPAGAVFHAIGRIQSRQMPRIVAGSGCVHGLCELRHVDELAKRCAQAGRRMDAFIEVNVSGEATKAGIAPAELPRFVDHVRTKPEIALVGLMAMAPIMGPPGQGADEAAVRRGFSTLRRLAQEHRLPRLSMGMSQDYVIAIEEGATDVRVGTRLFA